MFSRTVVILYLTKEKLKIARVALGKSPKVLYAGETIWNRDSLKVALIQAKSKLKTDKVRILLGEDVSYVARLKIPIETEVKNERSVVAGEIRSLIPEILDNDEWDYKETGKKDNKEKEIIAFAPVKNIFLTLTQGIAEAGITAEVIEPESVAKLRNENPIIGLALKEDLTGKDEQVLNLVSKEPKAVVNKKLLFMFLVVFVVGVFSISGIFIYRTSSNKRAVPPSAPTAAVSPIPTPKSSPTPEEDIVLTDYALLVLNGSGVTGAAAAVKDILTAEGFAGIQTGNADLEDATVTTIQLKKNIPEKVFGIIDRALNSEYEVTRSSELLTDDFEYDVLLIVGKVKK